MTAERVSWLRGRADDATLTGATVEDVKAFAEELSAAFLQCRDMGHAWRPRHAGRYRDGGFRLTHRCTRCRTERIRELTAWGGILSTSMKYPEGYLAQNMGRIMGSGRDVLRLVSALRVTPEGEFIGEDDD